jgi:hypothetical protein
MARTQQSGILQPPCGQPKSALWARFAPMNGLTLDTFLSVIETNVHYRGLGQHSCSAGVRRMMTMSRSIAMRGD